MKTKHRKTLTALYRRLTASNIVFADIETLIVAMSGEVREGEGSRIAFELGEGGKLYLHRPPAQARRQRNTRSGTCVLGWTIEESDHD